MISEIDILDWDMQPTPSKLYNVPRESIISVIGDTAWKLLFGHVDGMYSHCRVLETGEVVHLPAWTEVNIWNSK
jgi:hypothetical protein